MQTQRIPNFSNKSREGMSQWFTAMSSRGLLFHPEDAPDSIVDVTTGQPVFQSAECAKLAIIMADMFNRFGDDVCETTYPILMKTSGFARTL